MVPFACPSYLTTTRNLLELNQCMRAACVRSTGSSTPISFPCLSVHETTPQSLPLPGTKPCTQTIWVRGRGKKKWKRHARNIAAVKHYHHAGCLCVWGVLSYSPLIQSFAQRCLRLQLSRVTHWSTSSLPKLHKPETDNEIGATAGKMRRYIGSVQGWGGGRLEGERHPTPVFDPFKVTNFNFSKSRSV